MNLREDSSALRSAQSLAVAVTKDAYAAGDIEADELERRLEAILTAREGVFDTVEWVHVTMLGSYRPKYIASFWEWPGCPSDG